MASPCVFEPLANRLACLSLFWGGAYVAGVASSIGLHLCSSLRSLTIGVSCKPELHAAGLGACWWQPLLLQCLHALLLGAATQADSLTLCCGVFILVCRGRARVRRL